MASTELPEVFLLSLNRQRFFDKDYSSLFNSFAESAAVKRAKTSTAAVRYLDANNPKAILVTDEGLAIPDNMVVLEKVQAYIRNGGLVVVGLHFPGLASMDVFDAFFAGFGLPWKCGDYHRIEFQFNPASTLPAGAAKDNFPDAYSAQVVPVEHAEEHQKIFVPVPVDGTRPLVLDASCDPNCDSCVDVGRDDQAQAVVVGEKIGDGFLVYVGELLPGKEFDKIILALLGLRSNGG